MARRGLYAAALAAAALTMASCSSSSSGGHGSTAISGSVTPPPVTTSNAGPTGSTSSGSTTSGTPTHQQLQQIVLQQTDLPAGWTGKPTSPDAGNSDVDTQVQACIGGAQISQSDQVDKVQSDDFNQGESTISSDAASYKSQEAVDNRKAAITSPKADSCFNQALQEELKTSLPAGTTVNNLNFHLTPGSNGGPSNVVATAVGTVTVTAQGQTVTVYVSDAFISGNLVTATVQFEGLGQPIDSAVQAAAIKAVSDRVAAA
jgi:hypothetical protein